MPTPAEQELGEYFDYLWHDSAGVVYLPTQTDPADPTSWVKNAFNWPGDRAKAIRFTLRRTAEGQNVFASPALYNTLQGAGQRNDFKQSWVLYMDFDGNAIEDWGDKQIPEPDWKIQSSLPGFEHDYWQLDQPITDAEQLEDRTRAMAYSLGADTSGWDANQILRPVGTTNYPAPNKKRRTPEVVTTLERYNDVHTLEDFAALPSAKQMVTTLVLEGEIPDIETVIATQTWPAPMWELFTMSKEDLLAHRLDRSGSMQRLGYYAAEQGFTDEQIMSVLQSADLRWEKYLHRRDSARHLIDIINRARQKHGYMQAGDLNFAGLIGNAPVETVEVQDVYGFNEFVASDFHVEWQLDGLLAKEGIGVCTGFPGTGKTQWVIQMGAHLALGKRDFLGWGNTSDSPVKVLFLSLEMDANPLHLFVSTIAPEYDDLETLNRNFKLAPIGQPIPLDQDAGRKYLDSVLAREQPDLLIIDSLQMVMSKEMTDELAVKDTMNYLKAVRRKFGCAMVLVHHNRKKNAQDAKKHTELSDMYGSTYVAAAVDFVINLSRIGDEGQSLHLSTLKNRLGKALPPFEIHRNENLTYHLDKFTGITTPEGTEDGSPKATIGL